MDEENSNDVVLIENTEEDEKYKASSYASDPRPLMMLFERLISNDSKSNTVLTNAQILLILNKEFNMEVSAMHELEVDIYINILKKFLKDWPQWDHFDRVISNMKRKSSKANLKNILEQKYEHLKEYLQFMIELATPLAKETLEKLKSNETDKNKDADKNDIVLEVYCTRRMLNKFIYSQPNPSENYSIFHLMDYEPYTQNSTTPTYSFTTLLHWYGIKMSIELPNFQYLRYTNHTLSHVLVNEALGPRKLNTELDTSLHISNAKNSAAQNVDISNIIAKLDQILQHYSNKLEYKMVEEIFKVVKSDLDLNSSTVEVPGSYKQRLNKYPYTRRLFKEVKGTSHHKLYIEETITPILGWHVGKFIDSRTYLLPELTSWLNFECTECQCQFHGANFLTTLRNHFNLYHTDEPDWNCTNCRRIFKMADITQLGWKHEC